MQAGDLKGGGGVEDVVGGPEGGAEDVGDVGRALALWVPERAGTVS